MENDVPTAMSSDEFVHLHFGHLADTLIHSGLQSAHATKVGIKQLHTMINIQMKTGTKG